MSRPPPPTITVYAGGWQRTFGPGGDLVIGRDVHADVRLPQPVVSRAHVVLRFVDGHWVAIDNASTNGIFTDGRRVASVDVHNGTTVHIGDPDGPRVSFELGRDGGSADRPSDDRITTPTRRDADGETDVLSLISTLVRVRWQSTPAPIPPGSITIGREVDNDIVIPDMLASRHHARLIPTAQGIQLQDISSNGTFVNGQRVVTDNYLRENDVVTIGNIDMVFTDGTLVRRTEPVAESGGLDVRELSYTIAGNRTLLERVSFSAKPATLTAVIGPSGSGKSTLLNLIVGELRPAGGAVAFDGHDIHAEYLSLRSRIGMVPQDDVVHRQLTVNQALDYAAELRMAPDTTREERQWVVRQVLEELDMTPHGDTRVDKLSGGQRKRVSVALELLTGPSLLLLDEPTTGLDPALDQLVMKMLRQLADAGRVVVVVTHSLAFLDVCDQVLLLAPGGKTAFCGPPTEIGPTMGTTDWADIYTDIDADPDAAHSRFLARTGGRVEPPAPAREEPAALGKPVQAGLWRQLSTLVRRQVRLLLADRGYFWFLVLLPFIVGLLPLAVAGETGFGKADFTSAAPNEPKQIVVLLNLGAIFMGTALTIRQLVGERAIFHREQAAGLSTSMYLAAKVVVFGAAAVVQSALLVLIVTAPRFGKDAPLDAVVLGSPRLELFVDIAATCVAAMILGLLVSALAQNSNQVLPLMVVTVMAQLVLAGGFIPVTDRALDPISWFLPARWGLAATASTSDLTNTVAVIAQDSHWRHAASAWWFDILMLVVLSACYFALVRWRIRPKAAISAR